ncbi:MAG: hypothetical protein R3F41_06615 [Gammaproteobacteria bacterium]|nr:hypothetical protein [Pseudomonadales bacterium]MCP5348589.1 hypothetical protein [Pseudomonadales bacterium]
MKFQMTVSFISLVLSLAVPSVYGHGGTAVFDPEGNSDTFTALVRITCFNDGTGDAGYLVARIRDNSLPMEGLYLNMQILKGTQAISITDQTPGDADYTPYVLLEGGNGVYTLMLNHTKAGSHTFDLEWHCMTLDNLHTGTDILVDQYH